jgi:hypothetical protein
MFISYFKAVIFSSQVAVPLSNPPKTPWLIMKAMNMGKGVKTLFLKEELENAGGKT